MICVYIVVDKGSVVVIWEFMKFNRFVVIIVRNWVREFVFIVLYVYFYEILIIS